MHGEGLGHARVPEMQVGEEEKNAEIEGEREQSEI